MTRSWTALAWMFVLAAFPVAAADDARDVHEIKVEWYSPNGRWDIPLVCFEVMRRDPTILCTEFSPLRIQGGMGYQSAKVMAFATGAGPDVFNMWTYEIASYIQQGFLLPLNEFVGHDGVRADGRAKLRPDGTPDLNGQIDDDEALWDYWRTLDPLVRKIVTHNGTVYSIPARRSDYVGLMVRKDLLREHGMGEEPPRDWEELWRCLQRLTRPALRVQGAKGHYGRRGLYLHRYHIYLYPWVWAAGGRFVLEGKTNPKTGRTHWYPKEELVFPDPETGESLGQQPSSWKTTFTTPEVLAAYGFLWRLLHGPWLRDPETQEPVDLSSQELAAGRVEHPTGGGEIVFDPGDVIRGVARTYTTEDNAQKQELFERGEIACFQASVGTDDATSRIEARPDQIGFWAVPPKEAGGAPVLYFSSHWLGLSPALAGEENREKRDKAWTIASGLGSDLGKRMYTRYMVQQGMAMFMTPDELTLAGLPEYVEEIPLHWRRDYERVFRYRKFEPFNANWLQVARNDLAVILDNMAKDPAYDYEQALRDAETRANTYIMSARPEADMRRYRRIALVGLVLAGVVVALLVSLFIRAVREKAAQAIEAGGLAAAGGVYRGWLPWLLLTPALVSIAVWAYYPLLRGTAMAYMDYRLMGERSWVGVDNFINVFLDHQFQQSVVATLKYVVVALGLTFLAPIVLAIMLNEIPRFKQGFRTVFFLPQVCSGVVIMLLWKQLYEPSARGYLNQLVMTVGRLFGHGITPIDWLGSRFWAPICVVLPTLWAGVGMGSLIYLAALKSVPEDVYEAADLDGAGVWRKIRDITIPTLYPLIVINFVGAFIGTFHQMQNIFVMTGGGSGTRVLSLHIWLTAYADLKFGPATATAWVLGSMLIGFTVWQLRILKKVEFRRALEN